MLFQLKYMPHIDGLRAIAVLAVVLFHLDIPGIEAGYLGVDVFFVISGYLITTIIVRSKAAGSFSYASFYTRRALRILPALFVTCFVSSIAAFAMFNSEHLELFGQQLFHTLSFVSNFWFWQNTGYFAPEAAFLPLLHTWSLGVEEQFYLVWPFVLCVFIFRLSRLTAIAVLFLMFCFSLAAASYFYDANPDAVFYLLPFRIFELIAGALLVFIPVRKFSKLVGALLSTSGLIVLIFAFIIYPNDQQLPPTYLLVPTLASAFIIFAGANPVSNFVLSNPVAVWIGKRSYSLYLMHWPLIVFFRYWDLKSLSAADMVMVLTLSVVLSELSYRFVEQPCRNYKANPNLSSYSFVGFMSSIVLIGLMVPATYFWATEGMQWRIEKYRAPMFLRHEVTEVSNAELDALRLEGFSRPVLGYGSQKTDAKKAILLGDSHAGHYREMIDYIGKKFNVNFVLSEYAGCPPVFGTYKIYGAATASKRQEGCKKQIEHWQKVIRDGNFDYVLLSSRWVWLFEPEKYGSYLYRRDYLVDADNPVETIEASRRVFVEKIRSTAEYIVGLGAKVIVFSQVPNLGKNISGCNEVPQFTYPTAAIEARCAGIDKELVLSRLRFTDEVISGLGDIEGVIPVLPSKFLCSRNQRECKSSIRGTVLYKDDDHLNNYGGIYLATRWEKDKAFPFLGAEK